MLLLKKINQNSQKFKASMHCSVGSSIINKYLIRETVTYK